MTNAYDKEMDINMIETKERCFQPITLGTVFYVLRRMFR